MAIAVFAQPLNILTGGSLSKSDRLKVEAMKPLFAFEQIPPPPAPDYWLSESWAALPDKQDEADAAPPNTRYEEAQAMAEADVFFIHPTTTTSAGYWNAPIDDKDTMEEAAIVMGYCASVFNAAAKVYAPRYRQATLYAFFDDKTTSGMKAIEFAYSDVERAFIHYIKYYNHGRPFILAGHSQGSIHGIRLLQEKIIGTPLESRLVAAYLIGGPILRDAPGISPCRSETSAGVVIGWNTYARESDPNFFVNSCITWVAGSYQRVHDRPLLEVNPLSWRLNGSNVSASRNPGSLPFTWNEKEQGALPALIQGVCGADASRQVLIINKPTGPGFESGRDDMRRITIFNSAFGDYHNFDYMLFYESIRKNALDRVKYFIIRTKKLRKTITEPSDSEALAGETLKIPDKKEGL